MINPRIKSGRSKFDPLNNVRTSQVFFELVPGPNTPKTLAETLNVTPAAVIHQLRRLQEIGIVKLGRKSGKFQTYEIDWQQFIEVFLSRATRRTSLHSEIKLKRLLVGARAPRNKYFQTLIAKYFECLVEEIRPHGYRDLTIEDQPRARFLTVSDAIDGFNNGLKIAFRDLKEKEGLEDKNEQKLLMALDEWVKGFPLTAPEFALKGALEKMNLLTKS